MHGAIFLRMPCSSYTKLFPVWVSVLKEPNKHDFEMELQIFCIVLEKHEIFWDSL